MLLKIKQLLQSTDTQTRAWSWKIVAYCATTVYLVGCASTNNALIHNDPLSNENLQARASQIHSLDEAQNIEANAINQQQLADTSLEQAKVACYRKFFVNRCLDQVNQTRNDAWDAAQVERSAARLYMRQQQAEAQRLALTEKLNTYNREEAAKAPLRAQNAAAYQARQQAYQAKLAQAQAAQQADAPQRAQNVEDFNAKVKRIEAIKQKRIDDAKKLMPQ
ncbi:MAG: hypothetical protein H6R05_467 [Burkholderiaceae bacterium]|nr:hypothetical protein [Burkholderiaceae bacterium]